jgi:hypothetical protein
LVAGRRPKTHLLLHPRAGHFLHPPAISFPYRQRKGNEVLAMTSSNFLQLPAMIAMGITIPILVIDAAQEPTEN